MDFGILGPLEVYRRGEVVDLPGRTLPRLLAVLLLEAERVVPLSRLVDAVWDDRPPGRARVQNLVSDLRKALADPDREVVESVGQGYRLRLPGHSLDALDFEVTVRRARQLAQEGNRPGALAGLRVALRLWRGPALAGLTGWLIESGAQRWDEAHLTAIEDRTDLELSLGDHGPLVGELRELLAAHPYRQRIAGQLMIALYREGRAAEALAAFESVRARLADHLAIDPGQQLRDINTAILREDTALLGSPVPGIAAGAAEVAGPPVPAQLPADTGHFTGRDEQLSTLDARLGSGDGPSALVVLSGIGGAGKTALALHWAHRVRDRFPDGQLYVNLRGYDRSEPMAPDEALAQLLRALGVKPEAIPAGVAEASAEYRSRLADKRVLVVLDNALDAGQVRPMLPITPGSCTLVTSRHRLAGLVALDDAHPITVESLPQSESLRLLGSLVGQARVSAEPAAARRLVELCADLPLAIRIAAANLTGQPQRPLAGIVAELSADRLDRLAVDGDPTAAVAATFDLSYHAIDPAEQQLYLRLALLPTQDISRDLAVAIAGIAAPDADRLMSRLEAAHRIEQYRPGRFRLHDLVREYARRKADGAFDEPARQRVRACVATWYGDMARTLPLEEYGNVAAAYRAWYEYPTMSRLANGLFQFARAGYHLPELAELAQLGMAIGGRSEDPMDFARPCNLMVMVSYVSGDLATSAEYGRRLVDAVGRTAGGDVTGAARGNLGITLRQLGRYQESAELLAEAAEAAEAYGDQGNLVSCLSSLGEINRCLGRLAAAEKHLARAVELGEQLAGGARSADAVLSLGELYLDTGRTSAATALIVKAVGILERHPSHVNTIWLRLGQARLHQLAGRHTAAEKLLCEALVLAHEIDARRFMFVLQCELAELLTDTGRPDEAAQAVDRHADGADRHHTPETRAARLRVLCKIHTRLGDHDQAIRSGRDASEMFAAMPDPLRHSRSLAALADAYAAAGDHEAAAAAQRRAGAVSLAAGPDAPRALWRLRTLEG